MQDHLFNELLKSAEEMVAIEKGKVLPEEKHQRLFTLNEVEFIRKKQNENEKRD